MSTDNHSLDDYTPDDIDAHETVTFDLDTDSSSIDRARNAVSTSLRPPTPTASSSPTASPPPTSSSRSVETAGTPTAGPLATTAAAPAAVAAGSTTTAPVRISGPSDPSSPTGASPTTTAATTSTSSRPSPTVARRVGADDSSQPPIPLRSEGLRTITWAPAYEATFGGIQGGQ